MLRHALPLRRLLGPSAYGRISRLSPKQTVEYTAIDLPTKTSKRFVDNLRSLLVLIGIGALAPSIAAAYIDPGTGSMVLQIALATFLMAGVALKTFWHKVKGLIGLGDGAHSDVSDDE